jgi:hypothetical protein
VSKKAAILLALAFGALVAGAQGHGGGLIEDSGWAFLISPPSGWVWDSSSLRHQGIQGLFYRDGTIYLPSSLHMYISPTPKKPGGPATLAEFLKADEAAYMADDTGIVVRDLPPYSPGMDYRFELRDFDDSDEGYFQSLAYYEGEKAFFVFVLVCRSQAERERERASFRELLDSFTYIRKE